MFDVLIIGAGPAGYNCALECAKLGLNTALAENREVGGTCLNRGCIPTKSLLKTAEIYESVKKANFFGINISDFAVDYDKMYGRKEDVIKKLRDGIDFLLKKGNVTRFYGQASFIDKNTVEINGEAIQAKSIVIATGSVPVRLPVEGIELTKDSDNVLSGGVDGDRIVIIGGGVIGCEFACLYSSLGKSVTIIEAESRILSVMDRDITNYLGMALKKSGVTILTSAKLTKIEKDDSSLHVVAVVKDNEVVIDCDDVIVSVGRKANVDGLKLENCGGRFDKRIQVDENFSVNGENVYAIGDVCSKIQLAHLAEAQAINLAHILSGEKPPVDLLTVPSCIYTHPEAATVGKTEPDDTDTVIKIPYGGNGKAVIEDSAIGFCKLVYNKNDVIIGGVIMCPRATDMISEIALAVTNKLTKADIKKTIHPHPTLSETISKCAE